jgi:hypothetical protein
MARLFANLLDTIGSLGSRMPRSLLDSTSRPKPRDLMLSSQNTFGADRLPPAIPAAKPELRFRLRIAFSSAWLQTRYRDVPSGHLLSGNIRH